MAENKLSKFVRHCKLIIVTTLLAFGCVAMILSLYITGMKMLEWRIAATFSLAVIGMRWQCNEFF
jgi:hypothetical protein